MCLLKKSLYELKQAHRLGSVGSHVFSSPMDLEVHGEPFVFILRTDETALCFLIYFDHLLIIGNNIQAIHTRVRALSSTLSSMIWSNPLLGC